MRTGSVGNRSAEDMVKTLVEPKKTIVSSIRNKLLSEGFSEEVEYDAINIEPVLIYSKSEKRQIFVRHKWSLLALIPLLPKEDYGWISQKADAELDLKKYDYTDEDGNRWLRFEIPADEQAALEILNRIQNV